MKNSKSSKILTVSYLDRKSERRFQFPDIGTFYLYNKGAYMVSDNRKTAICNEATCLFFNELVKN